jgi:L-fucose mutarotase
MPLKGIPDSVSPELLYALSKMGHGDAIVIADCNFPSDSVAAQTVSRVPVRVSGSTSKILQDILTLMPLDRYSVTPVCVMDRVPSDKQQGLVVSAYDSLDRKVQDEANQSNGIYGTTEFSLTYIERFEFYELAKRAYCIVQTTDKTPYANVLVYKAVL